MGFLRLSPRYQKDLLQNKMTAGWTSFCFRIGCGTHLTMINYILTQIFEQLRAVVPISLYLILFRLLIFRKNIEDPALVFMGLVLLILGLMLFMEGLKLALVPLGELLGSTLPKKVHLAVVLLVAFVLGISVTLAEPAIGVLGTLSSMIEPTRAPYLFLLLNQWNIILMLTVGVGVGLAAVVGILRFSRGWSLKPIIFISVIITTALTCYINWVDAKLRPVVGLAWDCGAVTTGPVTVPIILSIGIGVIAHKRSLDPTVELSPLSGFGIVTLASLFPILSVEILALIAYFMYPGDKILAKLGIDENGNGGGEEEVVPIYEKSPLRELYFAVRAILPLVLLLLFILKVVVREKLPRVILFADNTPEEMAAPIAEHGDDDENSARSVAAVKSNPDLYVGTKVEMSLRESGKGLEDYAENPPIRSSASYSHFKDEEIGMVQRQSSRKIKAQGSVSGKEEGQGLMNDEITEEGFKDDDHEALHGTGEIRSDGYSSNLMMGEESTTRNLPLRLSATADIHEVGRFSRSKIFFVGIFCAQLGMILFNWGLTYGLSALGTSVGNILPGAFQELEKESGTPMFGRISGLVIVFGFGWVLGFLATIAEPALNILGEKVAHLTGGAFSKNLLIYSVSVGVATGIVLGMVKIVFPEVQLIYLILGTYVVALILTILSSEDFVNVAWDSAGVTTGPVTVPFVLTLGLSLGKAVHASDGFGILTMASVGPIISVLSCGLIIRVWVRIKGKTEIGRAHV